MDLIEGTVLGWYDALTFRKEWDELLDRPRFREAFTYLAQTRKTWPTPADFLEHLPPRKQLALTKQVIPADPEVAKARMAEIAASLGRWMRAPK